jgi:hypothetical protein
MFLAMNIPGSPYRGSKRAAGYVCTMTGDEPSETRPISKDQTGRTKSRQISLVLSDEQVEAVTRAGMETHGPSLNLILSGMIGSESFSTATLHERYRVEFESGRLSHALWRGLLIIVCFLTADGDYGITDVATRLGMNASTTYRYVSTLVAFGLVEQDPASRKYRLKA